MLGPLLLRHCPVGHRPLNSKSDLLFPSHPPPTQADEEATDEDNKNCSKDGTCGEVALGPPLSDATRSQP